MAEPLLSIRNLSVDYVTGRGTIRAVDRVSLAVNRGEIVGLAGESGCGKSTLAMVILRLLPPPAVIAGGQVLFEGRDLLALDEPALREVRWRRISIVFQSAMDALNPVLPIGEQITDALCAHATMTAGKARDKARELLELVGIPEDRLDGFAHQLSGGMRQRVSIAMALALDPALLILDEPTTALDVITEREILEKIRELSRRLGFAVLFVTHDLARMLEVSDRVAVFYAARLVESGPARAIALNPRHPYTLGLLRAFPSLHAGEKPESIAGSPPSLRNPPSGCRFHPRCPVAIEVCRERVPEMTTIDGDRVVACHVVTQEELRKQRAEQTKG